MALGDFIKNNFLDQKLYISCGEHAETITYDQAWAANKEFLYGVVLDVEDGVLTLEVPDNGIIYINCESIVSFWEPGLDYHRAVRTSLTRRVVGARRKDS
jgi:hypothetical protein